MYRKWFPRLFSLLLLIGLLCGCTKQDFTYIDAKQGVARVYCTMRGADGALIADSNGSVASVGSGFFVGPLDQDPEYLITNHHVVENYIEEGQGEWVTLPTTDGGSVTLKTYVDIYFDEETSLPATVVAYSETADVAILRLSTPTDQRIALSLLPPTEDMIGSQVYGIGFPGLSDNLAMDAVTQNGLQDMTVTSGTISRLLTSSGSGVRRIQTDMVIQHGNSGGPMVNNQGAVLGINSWAVTDEDSLEQNYYACNIQEAIDLLDQYSIPYALAGSSASNLPYIIGGAVLICAAVVVAAVLLTKGKRGKHASQPLQKQTLPAPERVQPRDTAAVGNPQDSGYRIQGTTGALAGKRFHIPKTDPLILGRNRDLCNVVFPNTPGVSGKHCAVWFKHDKLFLQDLGSTHGTFLKNGAKLFPNQPIELQVGDSFYLGSPLEAFVIAEKRGS